MFKQSEIEEEKYYKKNVTITYYPSVNGYKAHW